MPPIAILLMSNAFEALAIVSAFRVEVVAER
jgi:hypothetical protein